MIWILICAIGILFFYAKYRVFEKMNEKGWKALVPILNTYILFNRTWKKTFFYLYLCIFLLFGLNAGLLTLNTDSYHFLFLTSFISYVMLIILILSLHYHIAKYFKQSILFRIGMVVLYPVFLCILAFKKELDV
ncbi:MAG: hypothetical protein HUJ53_09530 [Holdemanella sp.]|nr:hypothetical protein [Holdemanella sp.]